MDVTQLAALVTVFVAGAVTELIRKRIVSKATLGEIATYASLACQAAEELYVGVPDAGKSKLNYAVQSLCKKFGISEDEAVLLVHSALTGLRISGVKGLADRYKKLLDKADES